jgi:hypothetical protein
MKHARVTAAAASLTAAVVVGGVGAASVSASAGVAALRFYEKPGTAHVIDNAPKGKKAGLGDFVLYASPVFDRHGKQVGTDHAVCVILSAAQSQCDSTLLLPKGQLLTRGIFGKNAGSQVAVIGGTGAYAAARGTMTMRPIKDGGSTLLINLV